MEANTCSLFPSAGKIHNGFMEKEMLERFLAEGFSLERIGEQVGKDPSTVGYWLKKHGLKAG